jgi:hypothetical protein
LSGRQWSARTENWKKQKLRKANTREKRSYKDWNGFWKENVNELGTRRRNVRYVMGGATSQVTEDCGRCSDDSRRYGKLGHFFINSFDKRTTASVV